MVPCRASSTYNFAPRRMKQIAVHGTLDAFVWERVRQLREMTSSTMKTEQRKSSLSHPRNSCPHIVYIRHRSCCATDFFFFFNGVWSVNSILLAHHRHRRHSWVQRIKLSLNELIYRASELFSGNYYHLFVSFPWHFLSGKNHPKSIDSSMWWIASIKNRLKFLHKYLRWPLRPWVFGVFWMLIKVKFEWMRRYLLGTGPSPYACSETD